MAEMNSRMNHSQCVPLPTLCLQIPSLQACTEGLPLVLQRPDNFPLVMGILQEMNQEKFSFSRCAGTHQRSFSISEVKQENADVEEHHHSLNSELCQEWSLKGVEELLTEPEELQLRHDCSQESHDSSVPYLEVCASDEKPLQSVQPNFNWNVSEQPLLYVDEKPMIQSQITSSFEEQLFFQENTVLHMGKKSMTIEGFSAPGSKVDVNSNSQLAAQVPSEVHLEDKVGLHSIQSVKREPEEVEAQAPTFKSFEEQKEWNSCLDLCQSAGKKGLIRLEHVEKFALLAQKSQLKNDQSSEPEPDLQLKLMMENRRLSLQNVRRNTSGVLASPAVFSGLEESHPGKGYLEMSPPISLSFVAEGSICPSVLPKKCQVLAEDRKLQSVTSVGESDCCELTLSLASSEPQVASSSPSLDGNEDKPVAKPSNQQEKHDGKCQRTSPHQWQQTRKRSASNKHCWHPGLDTMPAGTKKQLFLTSDGCCGKDGESPSERSGGIDHSNIFLGPKNSENTVQPDAEQVVTSNCKTLSNFPIENKGSRQILRSMPKTIDERGSPNKRESQKIMSNIGQVIERNSPMATDSSEAEAAPQPTEPHRKKMRGTLPLDDEGDAKDTRCHRSDGKSWRCVRECINGAYYCQYHLRKRRIGYNRRRNKEVNLDDLEAVCNESLKLSKKSH
ncbi:hypothetical protein GOP47_0003203 [Adiantum capillus-veneris]|uniref:WRC domain-containing protein n=1 Tax=Adiantum capillus-veneris TaxID=13818 RepID=A0A9D4VBI6_ADICA|nr:hypothetical protein GOP47_0003203 [Adiantum capillus-veneris]